LIGGDSGDGGSDDGGSGDGGTSSASSGDTIPVSAEQLLADYEANEVAADEKYKGKRLEVTGTIDNIGKDVLDNSYVALKTGKQYDFRSVQCYFDDNSVLVTLSKGRRVKITGRCDGLFGTLSLKDCKLVE
jgi:hypothetical protein